MLFELVVVPAVALAGNNSGAAFSTWPDTGQTTCYDAAGNVLDPCPAPGEPFHGQDAQYQGPARSYSVLGGGSMVRDNVTGLIWEVKQAKDGTADYTNPHDADNRYTCVIPTQTPTAATRAPAGPMTLKILLAH